jgi:hypothetical protein
MIAIEIDAKKLKELRAAVDRAGKKFKTEFAAALNATAKKARGQINQKIRTEFIVKSSDLNKLIKVNRKATSQRLVSGVMLSKTARLPLRVFGARQIATGVTYRISKNEGRKLAAGAFQGPKPGAIKISWRGNVFKRLGKARLPIVKLMGASPWGVFTKRRMTPEQIRDIKDELAKQMDRRIKLNILRAEGLVSK